MSSIEEVKQSVKLVTITDNAQHVIAYCARVSNPQNQQNLETEPKLLAYLVKHKHWSPFEMASMTLEITTTRAIASQIIRHRSFSFQEFSQRFARVQQFIMPYFRTQDAKNKQSSHDTLSSEDQDKWRQNTLDTIIASFQLYNSMVDNGVARECARMVLPLCTATTIYMTGTIRSWIHYLQLRTEWDTQAEHREIAEAAKAILLEKCPWLSEILSL
jgi:thymidylate synthase (FAD)